MRRLFFLVTLGISIFGGVDTVAQQTINRTKSKADFVVKNLGLKVDGKIRGMYGEVLLDEHNLTESFIDAKLDIKAIRTGIEQRDRHLLKDDFFHAEKYPTLSFKSDDIKKEGDQFIVNGQLTIKDVTKAIQVKFTMDGEAYTGGFEINRKDYHVHNGGFLTKGISDDVKIKFTVVLD